MSRWKTLCSGQDGLLAMGFHPHTLSVPSSWAMTQEQEKATLGWGFREPGSWIPRNINAL